MIQLGCCLPGGPFVLPGMTEAPASEAENLAAKCRFVLDCGFDFTECALPMLMNLSEDELLWLEEENKVRHLKLRAVNCIYVNGEKLSNPGESWEDLQSYIIRMIDTLARLQIPYAVFGSGGSRRIPDELTREEGLENLRRMMRFFADYGEKKGVTLVIEPLRNRESNVFNTLAESDAEIRLLNRPGVRLLADSFHMAEAGEEAENVLKCAENLKHCHIAEAPERTYPGCILTGDKNYNVRFAESLLAAGYTGGVSAECSFTDFKEDLPKACAYMRTLFHR